MPDKGGGVAVINANGVCVVDVGSDGRSARSNSRGGPNIEDDLLTRPLWRQSHGLEGPHHVGAEEAVAQV